MNILGSEIYFIYNDSGSKIELKDDKIELVDQINFEKGYDEKV